MSLWRVTITLPVYGRERKVWNHEYIVLAEDETEAKLKAIERFKPDGTGWRITAEVDYDGIIKSRDYRS